MHARYPFSAAALAAALLIAPVFAQGDGAIIKTATGEEFGTYLVTGENQPVYLFEPDRQGEGDAQAAESTCYDACADDWPPVVAENGDVEAGEGAMAALLGTIERTDGTMQVTYNGWPLYTYIQDIGAVQPTGQDIEDHGGEWYLVIPEGDKVGHAE